jgi:hypothetical protein
MRFLEEDDIISILRSEIEQAGASRSGLERPALIEVQ